MKYISKLKISQKVMPHKRLIKFNFTQEYVHSRGIGWTVLERAPFIHLVNPYDHHVVLSTMGWKTGIRHTV